MGIETQLNLTNNNDESVYSAYNMLFIVAGFATSLYLIAKTLESKNSLNYESRLTRIIAGLIIFVARLWHTSDGDLEINNPEKKLIALGPHRTSWEAAVVGAKIKGTPPRFFATDAYNAIPGVASFLKMFKVIPVGSHSAKGDNGRSANAGTIELASKVLDEKGCVALFPQGNFARIGQEPPRVYAGAARIAMANKIPIQVIRLDGFWCFQNPLIPSFICNNAYYRTFFSVLHMNNVRATLCCEIDFHLKDENKDLSDEAKIEEICAQLYAYYRHTQELSPKQIDAIKTEISNKNHLLIWKNRVKRDELGKELVSLKSEGAKYEEETLTLMKSMSM